MILESLIAGSALVVTSAIWAGAWLTNRVHERENAPEPPEPDPKAEERRVLERAREEWADAGIAAHKKGGANPEWAQRINKELSDIDEKLLELARRQP